MTCRSVESTTVSLTCQHSLPNPSILSAATPAPAPLDAHHMLEKIANHMSNTFTQTSRHHKHN